MEALRGRGTVYMQLVQSQLEHLLDELRYIQKLKHFPGSYLTPEKIKKIEEDNYYYMEKMLKEYEQQKKNQTS